jgi:hypothetical protein
VDSMKIKAGETLTLDFRNDMKVRVTDHMLHALTLLRPALIEVARHGGTMTYGEASSVMNRAYAPNGLGRALDALSIDCERRGEPSLAALVVHKDSGEVGSSFVGEPAAARSECYQRWKQTRTKAGRNRSSLR